MQTTNAAPSVHTPAPAPRHTMGALLHRVTRVLGVERTILGTYADPDEVHAAARTASEGNRRALVVVDCVEAPALYTTSEDPDGAPFTLASFVAANADAPLSVDAIDDLRRLSVGGFLNVSADIQITRVS